MQHRIPDLVAFITYFVLIATDRATYALLHQRFDFRSIQGFWSWHKTPTDEKRHEI